jgi:predicted phosphoadenosine phosphosulfate sulfurtransferase
LVAHVPQVWFVEVVHVSPEAQFEMAVQFAQLRFTVAEGVFEAYWPALQVVHAVQLVAPVVEA